MPLPKIKGSGVADITKEDEENNSLDTFIRQAIGKEPFLSFSRVNDSPVPWIQLLHALDQQDLPGWPLLSPLKIQMQKCEKCSREFCSTINYRRHLRLHRRNLNLDKDSTTKNRVLLQEFWDKLSVEKTMEIMSFEDVFLEGVTGHSIIKKLASFIRKPGFTSLPQSYIRAGSALLDIVQARPSRFPVSSQELFSILDDASEKTFLCAGTAESLQKYVFDGEAGKIGLEMRNSIACTSFLVEQKLVKACLADKDAEALRYQKLLVEEEEAAQKRQAAVLERKRQKKLKQKEQKVKEEINSETFYPEDRSPSPPSSSLVFTPESDLEWSENPCSPVYTPDPAHIANPEGCCGEEHETGYRDAVPSRNVEHRTYRSGRRHVNSRSHAPKLQKSSNGFHTSHNYQVVKLGPMQKHVSYRDSRTQSAVHGGKVWTPKTKTATDEESYGNRLQVQGVSLLCQDKKSEVLIGSISVTLRNQNGRKSDENLSRALESCASDHSVPIENGFHEKPNKIEAAPGIISRPTGKLWRPVSLVENGGQFLVRNGNDTSEVSSSAEGQPGCRAENNSIAHEESPSSSVDGELGGLKFSSQVAEAFLAKRWTEAIASDHVTLVLFPESNPPPGCPEVQDNNNQATVPPSSSKLEQSGIPEKHLTGNTTPKSSAILIPKMRPKLDKGSKVSTVEKMMKSLRLDISQLRRALQESRSDTARLQSFVKKQAEQIREQKVYIKELEDEWRKLSGKVEQLLIEMKATEEDAERWREACELEVDAGKRVVEERDKVIGILKQEVEKTNSSLKASNNKLKSKEELAVAAMAAQSAAEKSIQLADSRAAGLQRRIEELTKQLEDVERLKNKHGHKARRSCCPWPWLPLRFDSPDNVRRGGARNGDIRRVLPEMEALLNLNVLL